MNLNGYLTNIYFNITVILPPLPTFDDFVQTLWFGIVTDVSSYTSVNSIFIFVSLIVTVLFEGANTYTEDLLPELLVNSLVVGISVVALFAVV